MNALRERRGHRNFTRSIKEALSAPHHELKHQGLPTISHGYNDRAESTDAMAFVNRRAPAVAFPYAVIIESLLTLRTGRYDRSVLKVRGPVEPTLLLKAKCLSSENWDR